MKKNTYKNVAINIKLLCHNLSIIEKISLLSINKARYIPLPTFGEFIESFNKILKKLICELRDYVIMEKLLCELVKLHNNFVIALSAFGNYTVKQSSFDVEIINPQNWKLENYCVNYEEYLELVGSGSPLNINLHNKIQRYKYVLYAIKKKAYCLCKKYIVTQDLLIKHKVYKICDEDICDESLFIQKCGSCKSTKDCPKSDCSVPVVTDIDDCNDETECPDDELSEYSCHMTL